MATHETLAEPSTMPLLMLQAGARARVTRLDGGRAFNQRLAAMGILPGAELALTSGGFAGPVMVEVGGSRFALGRGAAHRVHVEPLRQLRAPCEQRTP